MTVIAPVGPKLEAIPMALFDLTPPPSFQSPARAVSQERQEHAMNCGMPAGFTDGLPINHRMLTYNTSPPVASRKIAGR